MPVRKKAPKSPKKNGVSLSSQVSSQKKVNSKLTKKQLAAKKAELLEEAAEADADKAERKRGARKTRKTRATFAEFKKMRSLELQRLWRLAISTEIKKRHMKLIMQAKQQINSLLNPEDDTASVAGSKKSRTSSVGKARKASSSLHQDSMASSVGGSDDASNSVSSAHVMKLVAKVEKAIAHSHERLGKLHAADKEWDKAVFYLDIAIAMTPKKTTNMSLLTDVYKSMFAETGDFQYLTKASGVLQMYLSKIQPTVFTAGMFPTVIFDLARVYETFGAFEGALELYGRILEMFPKYAKYQLVLFRSCIVMAHLSSLRGSPRQILLGKAVEMLQFILESQPDESNLDREQLCLLYARVLTKQDEANKTDYNNQMVQATLSEVFYLRKAKKLTGKIQSHVQYFKQVNVWREFAEAFGGGGEPTIACDMFDMSITLLKKTPRPTMSYGFLLDISQQYAKFQDYETAISYAQGAWEMEQYNPRARVLLAQWSEDFKW
ncbi:hypothetical protein TeGR_g13257 [Tetraparma gracilis]|uniref:Uncharacterized protein n=1 Tax=Tetraparma gracilis TaxID=2962635 RepID=A0ABQ6NAD8_9STRA|nr:hypothetical protein TeGR_g13257 [Tetraparma gracilis]